MSLVTGGRDTKRLFVKAAGEFERSKAVLFCFCNRMIQWTGAMNPGVVALCRTVAAPRSSA